MYKIKETTVQADMLLQPPFGPGFPPLKVSKAVKMEVWARLRLNLGQMLPCSRFSIKTE
jgi:hypothetical protein